MATPKTEGRIYAEKICKANPELPDKTVARILIRDKAHLYKNLEGARTIVRTIRGHKGDLARASVKDKSLYQAPDYNYNPANTYQSTPKQYAEAQERKIKKSKYYIFTWAQNNTPVHKDFFSNLLAYKDFLGAEVHVILGRYKNPTSTFTTVSEEHWDVNVVPFADANRHSIHKHLTLLSDIKIQPTAVTPLSGMEGITGLSSAILGHPRVHMKVVPALEGYTPKIMMTTGACTKMNYTDSKAGKKGEFHHTLGFVIAEIKDAETHPFIRQVTALNNGSFTDLCFNVKNGCVNRIEGIDAAVLGDIHVGENDLLLNKVQKGWLSIFRPKYTMVHDVFSGYSISHHEEKDPIRKYHKLKGGKLSLELELSNMLEWLKSMQNYNLVIVPSNHDEWVDRWIKSNDWKKDLQNAEIYMNIATKMLSEDSKKGVISRFIDDCAFKTPIKTLSRLDSFIVNGWELASHGDKGANGAKGSMVNFKRLATKMVVADSHTPSREDGVLYAGTSSLLRMGYNVGASSWRHADVIIHKDKKAQHILYMGKNHEFTTFKLK